MIENITIFMPWFWLVIMVICIFIEAFTMNLTTIWGAIASLPIIFIAKTTLPIKWQLLIFALLTVILVIFTRPFAIKKLKIGKDKTNVNSMIGEEVLITKTVSKFQKGEAKAKNGVIWTVTANSDVEIPIGTTVKVVDVNGNTLIIENI